MPNMLVFILVPRFDHIRSPLSLILGSVWPFSAREIDYGKLDQGTTSLSQSPSVEPERKET